ncbi:MAG: plasmid partitioning protein RepB C-terminal domain-containing protein [Terracidiphilus sp.]
MKIPADVAFQLKTVLLPIASISARTSITQDTRKSKKYRQIAASIEHVGLIEPLVVSPKDDGTFLLLDGALRMDILAQRKDVEVRCILATDDEGYTYNKRVSHLSNIGEHYMILKALSNGVSEKMISESLNVDVETIRRKRSLLDGICPEVVQLLTNRRVGIQAYWILRKMQPLGQIQAAERMIHANNFSSKMATALLTITKPELLLHPAKTPRSSPGSTAKLALLQEESDTLLTDVKKVEETYATQALDLTLSMGYVEHLLGNVKVEKYLDKNHPEILSEFKKLLGEKAEEMSRAVPESVQKTRAKGRERPKGKLPPSKSPASATRISGPHSRRQSRKARA